MKYKLYYQKINDFEFTAECKTCVEQGKANLATVRFSKTSKWNIRSHYMKLHKEIQIDHDISINWRQADNEKFRSLGQGN